MLDPQRAGGELEPRRRADQGLPRPTRSSASISRPSTPRGSRSRRSGARCSRSPGPKAGLQVKAGGCARTARASGRASSSTASTRGRQTDRLRQDHPRHDRAARGPAIALLEAERRFRLLVQGVTDYAIYMLDPEGQVTNWNAGAERIKGYTPDEIVGEHFAVSTRPRTSTPACPSARWRPRAKRPLRGGRLARAQGRHAASGPAW